MKSLRNNLLIFEDGLKLFFRSKRKRFFGVKKYSGNSLNICEQIINDCFNKKNKYFMVSPNNFNQFYSRDFGMVCESLITLGFKKEVRSTLIYAMDLFVKHGRITTQINSRGKPLDFPCYSPESASYMLNSLILLNDKELLNKYKSFFLVEANHIFNNCINTKSGLVLKSKNFSSMKDYAKQKSSCYVNCLLGLFAVNIKKIGLKTGFDKFNYSELLMNTFFRDGFFVDDLSGKNLFSGDANVFPFWTGLIKDKKIFISCFNKIKEKKLDVPFALKYNNRGEAFNWGFVNFLNKNYEDGTIWLHLGVCYLKVLKLFNFKKELSVQLRIYDKLIISQKSFFEVYNPDGSPFKSWVFEHDEGMLWCAGFLDLIKK